MAKAIKVKVKMESTAGTGTFFVAEKNPRTHPEKLSMKNTTRSRKNTKNSLKRSWSNYLPKDTVFQCRLFAAGIFRCTIRLTGNNQKYDGQKAFFVICCLYKQLLNKKLWKPVSIIFAEAFMSKQPYRESPFFRFFRMAKKQKQKQNVPSSPRTEKYFRFLPICNQSFWYAHADEGKWRGQIRLRSRLFQLGLFYQQNDPSVIRKKIKSIFQKKDAFFYA